jgi:hypothetical protein
MIKGEEAFVQAIKNVRAKGALKVELLVILEMEYRRNPDPPPTVHPPESEYLEDVKVEYESIYGKIRMEYESAYSKVCKWLKRITSHD